MGGLASPPVFIPTPGSIFAEIKKIDPDGYPPKYTSTASQNL